MATRPPIDLTALHRELHARSLPFRLGQAAARSSQPDATAVEHPEPPFSPSLDWDLRRKNPAREPFTLKIF